MRPLRLLAAFAALALPAVAGAQGTLNTDQFSSNTDIQQVLPWGGSYAVGLIVPAVFTYMTYDCVRRRANQSATGILYVATVLVIVGEGIAESEIATWRVKVGDVVAEDQPLVDMLTVAGQIHDGIRRGVSSLNNAALALEETADDYVQSDHLARDEARGLLARVGDAALVLARRPAPRLVRPGRRRGLGHLAHRRAARRHAHPDR